MNAQERERALFALINRMGMWRKAERWDLIPVLRLPEALKQVEEGLADGSLQTFTTLGNGPCSDFPEMDRRPVWHVQALPNGARFLIDTEGYTYARYAIRLPDAPLPPCDCDLDCVQRPGMRCQLKGRREDGK